MSEAGSLTMSGWDKEEHVHGRRIIYGTCACKVRVGGSKGSYEAALLLRQGYIQIFKQTREGHCQLVGTTPSYYMVAVQCVAARLRDFAPPLSHLCASTGELV